ncbi:MAG TPA: hypothetical protein VFV34_16675, partial [Blastocatellia bacterium]|nr:hypothetical protein [Blastocatellia bacterium]
AQVSGVRGIYRSDDGGVTWVRINDDQHQYASTGNAITGDQRVYGRVFFSTNGRGIIWGEPGAAGPDFSLSASPSSVTINRGQSGTSTITITRTGGFTGSVAFSASNLPSGVTASFSPASATGGSSTVTLTASSSAAIGSATINITGTSGSLTHSTSIGLVVNAPPDFSLSASPASLTINRGASGTSNIAITRTGGFTSSVAFSASGLPTGVTASFNPTSTTGNSSTLTLTASSTATTGPATVTVTGTGGGLTRVTPISLTINAPTPDFSLSASPASLTVNQGASGTSTVSVTRLNGFTSSVAFSATGLPTGVTASFNPTSTTGTSTVVTLSASSTATAGPATVMITGTGGGLTRTVSIALTINAPIPNFSLAANPATVSVAQGGTATSAISITRVNGFTSSVTLSATGLPSGVTAGFNPASTTGNTSTLTFTATAAAATGQATVTVTGTGGGLTRSVAIALTVSGGTGGTGGVTVTPAVTANGQWFNEQQLRISNTGAITSLSITIVIQRTTGVSFNGQYNTVGPQITQSNTSTTSTITYQFNLAAGQTLSPGNYTFAAQTSGSGTVHPTAGDTYTVTYTTGGTQFTQTGHF